VKTREIQILKERSKLDRTSRDGDARRIRRAPRQLTLPTLYLVMRRVLRVY
jgi:hypothetical protein